jgi:hypothetical protein
VDLRPLPVFVEVHVDDEILGAQPDLWEESHALVMAIAQVAEIRAAKISFRFRTPFAEGAQGSDALRRLGDRGHEVGAHAHGEGIGKVVRALRVAGVVPVVATPGLVQAGRAGRGTVLKQCASMGITRVTDHGVERAWAYEGLAPRLEHGITVISPTVRPFDWGLMDKDGTRHPLSAAAIDQLRLRERQAQEQGAAYFGFAIHEHDLTRPGTLRLDGEALALLSEYLDERVVRSADIPGPAPPPTGLPPQPVSDRRLRFARAIHMATDKARKTLPKRSPRKGPSVPANGAFALPVDDRSIVALRKGSPKARAVLVVSHGGRTGGCSAELSPFGLGLNDILANGWAVYLFDRAGTGASPAAGPLTPGNPAHTADYTAVLRVARDEEVPVVALSWSAGGIPVLRAALRGDRPDAWVDAEGPADRWSLIPPGGNELSARDPWRDGSWAMLEPARMIRRLERPYARLQATRDHVHGDMVIHADRMVAAASRAGLPIHTTPPLEGHIHGHPAAVIAAIDWAIAEASRPR